MSPLSSNSWLNSLKGKIWLATSALALFICVFGIISYIIVSLLTNDPFYAVFIPFLFLAFAVMVFGWWLANEVVHPIEKVTLLAKSMERGTPTSLPKTLGSSEVDELLQSLHRNNRQTRVIVGLMDEVAAGNLNVALAPLQNSDRLTASFQQLLAKVSESIQAKQDLEKLQKAVDKLNEDVASIGNGNLRAEISTEFAPTKKIAEAIKYLIRNFSEIAALVKTESKTAQTAVNEIRKMYDGIIQQDEQRVQELSEAALTLKQTPEKIQKISENLAAAAEIAAQSIEKAGNGELSTQANLEAVNRIRKQVQETIKQILKLQESSREIGKIGKSIGDLAHRTQMIALNVSIQTSSEESGNERGMRIIVEEIERLAERADSLNKQISTIEKTVLAEIIKAENNLQTTFGEAAHLSKFAIETGNYLSELEKNTANFLNLQNKQAASAQEQTMETERAFATFIESIGETEETVRKMKKSHIKITEIIKTLENLQFAVAEIKTDESFQNSSVNFARQFSEMAPEENI